MENQNLPDDLFPQILHRLPVKSLVRFKSVCKYWYSLIQSPSFVSLHLRSGAAQNPECILVKHYGGVNGAMILSLVHCETPTRDVDTSFTGIDIKDLQLLGPCNGIVCLTNKALNNLALNSTIVMWNPSIREFRVLPKPSYKNDHFSTLGFGFDPSTDSYKVVKFGFHTGLIDTEDDTVEIYDSGTDSWRRVELEPPFGFGLYFTCSCCVSWNGDFYWFAGNRCGDWAIIVFRMADEVFGVIPLPEVCLLDKSKSNERRLFVLNDSLAVVICPSVWLLPSLLRLLDKSFDVWVMEEQGVEVSWAKKFTIRPLHERYFALGFWSNGDFLLESSCGQLMSYRIDTQQIKEYQVYDQYLPRGLQVLLCAESLVSIRRQN